MFSSYVLIVTEGYVDYTEETKELFVERLASTKELLHEEMDTFFVGKSTYSKKLSYEEINCLKKIVIDINEENHTTIFSGGWQIELAFNGRRHVFSFEPGISGEFCELVLALMEYSPTPIPHLDESY